MAETLNVMMEHFTSANEEVTDDYHKLIRAQNKTPVTTEDDKPFTTAEIRDAIYAMNRNKAPSQNGITSDILQRAYDLLPKSNSNVQRVFEDGVFPQNMEESKPYTHCEAREINLRGYDKVSTDKPA